MKKTSLRISIVIPAYNEEDHIGSCLEAIALQQIKPFEVIVVNSLSTVIKTSAIASQYPFVTLVNEHKKGVVHARDHGFDLASGDIIGRIDADTLLPKDWTLKLEEIFADKEVSAVSGGLHFYDIGWSQVIDGIDAYFRAWMAKRMLPSSRVFLLGANMAIRKSAWETVKNDVCSSKGLHEDLDLAIHMSRAGQKVIFDPSLIANVSARRIDCSPADLAKYALLSPITYLKHNAREHVYMYPLIAIVLINYLILRILFRAFDDQAQHFSLKSLVFSQSVSRVNPAEFM